MRIFIIGDVVGNSGVAFVRKHLRAFKKLDGIGFCIANGENAAQGNGITKAAAYDLFDSGVDVITMGNHTFNKTDIFSLIDDNYPIIRPSNFPAGTAGEGYILVDVGEITVAVVNANGRIYLDAMDCPFRCIDNILAKIKGKASVVIVDFHAEATSEKIAMGYYLNGRVSAVVGTHTHVQTADERILDGGTAYITDIGMTGPKDSILGVKKEIVIKRFLTNMPHRFEVSDNEATLSGVVITVDEYTGKATAIERINLT